VKHILQDLFVKLYTPRCSTSDYDNPPEGEDEGAREEPEGREHPERRVRQLLPLQVDAHLG